jgi:hypothetical protein
MPSQLTNLPAQFDPSPFFSSTSALFLAPSAREGCACDLSPLLSAYYALFCAMETSQPLSCQSLAHSFPCNGGWGCIAAAQLPEFRTLFQVPYPLCPFFLTLTKTAGVWGHSFPNRSAYSSLQPANFTPPLLCDLCVENTPRPLSVCAPSADRSVPNVFVRSCTSFASSSSAFHS